MLVVCHCLGVGSEDYIKYHLILIYRHFTYLEVNGNFSLFDSLKDRMRMLFANMTQSIINVILLLIAGVLAIAN